MYFKKKIPTSKVFYYTLNTKMFSFKVMLDFWRQVKKVFLVTVHFN